MTMPTRSEIGHRFAGGVEVFGQTLARLAVIAEGIEGAGGTVLTVSGPIIPRCNHVAIIGFLVLVLAQSTRWVCAPLAASAFQRGEEKIRP